MTLSFINLSLSDTIQAGQAECDRPSLPSGSSSGQSGGEPGASLYHWSRGPAAGRGGAVFLSVVHFNTHCNCSKPSGAMILGTYPVFTVLFCSSCLTVVK